MPVERTSWRVALVDDHPMTLLGLKGILKDWPHGAVVLDALSGPAYTEALPAKAPIDINLVDLVLAGQDGLAARTSTT